MVSLTIAITNNDQTDNTSTSNRTEFSEIEQIDTIRREFGKFLEEGLNINRIALSLPESTRNRLFSLAMFFERQEQLKRRANTGQLLRSDLELIEQIERIVKELDQIVEDIKKLNDR